MRTGHLRGALFSTFVENSATNLTIQFNKSLQAYGRTYYSMKHILHRADVSLKRASLRWSVSIKAMISVEASIAIPVFLFAFLEVISLLNCLSIYSEMLYRIKETIEPVSIYANAYESLSKEQQNIGVYLQYSMNDVVEDVSFSGSQINKRGNYVVAKARYEIHPEISLVGTSIPMQNYYYLRLWTGYDDQENGILSGYVYITKTGDVYHTFRDCTHISLSVMSIPKSEIKEARNESGEAYSNCPMCLEIIEKEERLEQYYITKTGNKYHGNISCSALKRTILCVTLEEVEDRALCKRCEKRSSE